MSSVANTIVPTSVAPVSDAVTAIFASDAVTVPIVTAPAPSMAMAPPAPSAFVPTSSPFVPFAASTFVAPVPAPVSITPSSYVLPGMIPAPAPAPAPAPVASAPAVINYVRPSRFQKRVRGVVPTDYVLPKPPRTAPVYRRPAKKAAKVVVAAAPVIKVPLTLWSSQFECQRKTLDAFTRYPVVLNTSVTGAGKTYLTLKAAVDLGLNVLVLCPASLQAMWREKAASLIGVNLIDCLSYEKAIGSGKNGCNHPYLIREDDVYKPTLTLINHLSVGTLIIMDEVAHLKNNDTKAHAACHAVIKAFSDAVSNGFYVNATRKSRSRAILSAAVPWEKKKYTASFLQLFGLTSQSKMHNYDQSDKEYELLGMQEIIDSCRAIDPITTNSIVTGEYSNKVTHEWCWRLYLEVIKPRMVFDAPKPDIAAKFFGYNGFYDALPHEVHALEAAVNRLKHAIRDVENGKKSESSLAAVQKALVEIAKIKVPMMSRVAHKKLMEDPNAKVLLFVEYYESIDLLCQSLAQFSPRVLNGQTKEPGMTKEETRSKYVKQFQEHNTNSRLLVVHPEVGGAGLSLDDTDGKFPRFSWYIPTYRFIDLVQSAGRTHRGTTKSDATVTGIYCKQFPKESSMLESLLRKSNIAKDVVASPDNIKFPGEYETYIDGVGIYAPGTNVELVLHPELAAERAAKAAEKESKKGKGATGATNGGSTSPKGASAFVNVAAPLAPLGNVTPFGAPLGEATA